MTPIWGYTSIIELLVSGVYYPVFCGTDLVFKEEKEQVEASTITSSIFKEWRVRMMSWTVDVTGLSKIDNTDGQIAYFHLLQASVRMEAQTIRITFKDQAGNAYQIGGTAYILSSGLTAPATEFSEATVTFLGTGGFSLGTISAPGASSNQPYSDWWPVVNGNAYVAVGSVSSSVHAYTLVNTDVVLDVWRSGIHLDIVTGTPGNGQCRFNTGTLRIEVQSANPFNTGETLFIEFKR